MKADPLARRLGDIVAGATGQPFAALRATPVAGGCIHTALRLEGGGAGAAQAYFVKLAEPGNSAMLACEAEGLAALAESGCVRVPRVVAEGADDERAWLVLEWLDLASLGPTAAASLGRGLAALHRLPQPRFGWARDNFIGASVQPNGWSDDWLAFWREKRLAAQLRLAARNRLPSRMIDRGERLAADCEAFFRNHRPAPSLLHGDLWGGNASATANGEPVVFDPAVYAGDREADLAMTELFGGFPGDFASAYRDAWPLDDGYRVRRAFYNLYHVLNHANLFAGGYVGQAGQTIEQLLAEIG